MNIITVNNLVKKFGQLTAVSDVSFAVPKGSVFAFLGPNGAGKTTTIKMLTTLLQPTAGTMSVNGFDPITQQLDVRKSFGIVFQDQSLDDELSAWENLEFHGVLYHVPKETRRQRMEQLLRFVELWERKDDLVKHFSGGMKRRLEIARGLLHHPDVLFLDEPTLGLDPQTRQHIWSYIKQLNEKEGITVFFTTHYMPEAEDIATKIAVIDKGRIVAQGTVADVKKQGKAATLEQAFIKLTGHNIREESAGMNNMRMHRRVWKR